MAKQFLLNEAEKEALKNALPAIFNKYQEYRINALDDEPKRKSGSLSDILAVAKKIAKASEKTRMNDRLYGYGYAAMNDKRYQVYTDSYRALFIPETVKIDYLDEAPRFPSFDGVIDKVKGGSVIEINKNDLVKEVKKLKETTTHTEGKIITMPFVDYEIQFQADYILDMCKVMAGDTISMIHYKNALRPVNFTDGNINMIVLPCRTYK